jgi:urease accessory protein
MNVMMNQARAAEDEPVAGSDTGGHAAGATEWPATLQLAFGRSGGATRLLRNRHRGPLCVQRPFYPEGAALPHVYLLHPPGGIVSGDRLAIRVDLGPGSQALFTTPGAGRVYRARADRCLQQQQVRLTLDSGACAEWLPGENILYPGAFSRSTTRFDLAHGSVLLGWEIHCIGLPASGMPFDTGTVTQRFEVFHDGAPRFIDCLHLEAANEGLLQGRAGLAGRTVCGLFVSGPFADAAECGALLDRLRAIDTRADTWLGITLVNGMIAIRYLGHCAWQARQLFIHCWRLLRPVLLGRNTCLPRIWAT